MCGALIFRNGHEVYSRVGDMSRTFNHLFVCHDKHANTNFSYMFTSRENFFGKRGARDTLFHHKGTVDVDTSLQQCETRQRNQTRKQVRGENNSISKDRPKSIGMWGISNMRVSNQYYSFY